MYEFLNGTLIPNNETLRQLHMSKGPWAYCSVKATADYLGCSSIHELMEQYEATQQDTIRKLEHKLHEMSSMIVALKLELESTIENRFLQGDCTASVRLFTCRLFDRQSYSPCGNKAVFIGCADASKTSSKWEVTVKCPCGESDVSVQEYQLYSKNRRSIIGAEIKHTLQQLSADK